MSAEELPLRSRVADRYELVERLAYGPMGSRWRVTDSRGPDGRLTWIPNASPPEDVARRLTRFGHLNVVPVREVGTHLGGVFVVSAIAAGVPLLAFLAHRPGGAAGFALKDARALIDQAAQSIVAAHRGVDGAPIVHGGPLFESIWVEKRGESQRIVTVDDFSLPILCGGTRTVADDVAALGALLGEVLLGEAVTPMMDLAAVSLRLRPDVDRSVWDLVHACRDVDKRPPSAQRFRDRLRIVDWTAREVASPRSRIATPVPALVTFERALPRCLPTSDPIPPIIEPPWSSMASPPPPAPVAAPEALPTVLEVLCPPRTTPGAVVLPAPAAPPPQATARAAGERSLTSAPAVAMRNFNGRAQLGRGFGVLSAGRRRLDTPDATALPTGPAAEFFFDTLKAGRLLPPRREEVTAWFNASELGVVSVAVAVPTPETWRSRTGTVLPVTGPDMTRSIAPAYIDSTIKAPRMFGTRPDAGGVQPAFPSAFAEARGASPATPSMVLTTPARRSSRAAWLWAALVAALALVITGVLALR